MELCPLQTVRQARGRNPPGLSFFDLHSFTAAFRCFDGRKTTVLYGDTATLTPGCRGLDRNPPARCLSLNTPKSTKLNRPVVITSTAIILTISFKSLPAAALLMSANPAM